MNCYSSRVEIVCNPGTSRLVCDAEYLKMTVDGLPMLLKYLLARNM